MQVARSTSQLESVMTALCEVDGVRLACLADPVTATPIMSRAFATASNPGDDDRLIEYAAAGFTDMLRALILTASRLTPDGELIDAVVTLTDHYYLMRQLPTGNADPLLALLVLSKDDTNLAMALRQVRHLSSLEPDAR